MTSSNPPRLPATLFRSPSVARLLCPLAFGLILTCCAFAASPARKSFDLPAGDAAKTLRSFSEQSGEQIIFPVEQVRGVKTKAVKGQLTAREALDQMLAGTDLAVVQDAKTGALTVHREKPGPKIEAARADLPPDARAASLAAIARGQSAPAAPAARDDTKEAVVELSPFEVNTTRDVGYEAGNTTSGSRLNSRLKDTPASISPFTPEFLSDIGATNLEEMLGYALNIEGEFDDSIAGFSNTAGRAVTGGDFKFRIRGQGAGVSRDFVENLAPNDLYNVERAEVTSGPNSILFGVGSSGGLVSLSGKKAQVNRNKTSLKTTIGSWDYHRVEADHNQVILPKQLSVRLLGLYQNALGWRKWDFNDQKRGSAAVTWKPFKSTTVNVSGEKGRSSQSATVALNATDGVTAWAAAGRPVIDGAAAAAVGTASFGGADRFTFDERAGIVYNLRGELQSVAIHTDALLPPSLSPYNFNLTGPGAQRRQDFSSYQVQVAQQLPHNVSLELAFFHNDQDHFIAAMGNAVLLLRGDPNRNVPNVNNTGTIPNPRAGQLYIETLNPWEDSRISANDAGRLSAAWEVDLGKWFGRHRIAALLENSFKKQQRRPTQEILVDSNNVPIANAANPEANILIRRNYVVEGDFSTYYAGNPEIAVPSFTYNGRTITSRFVARTQANNRSERDFMTTMVAAQSSWFKDRLVTTVGYRLDRIQAKEWLRSRIVDPNDPRVTSRRFVLNEWDFDGRIANSAYQPTTFTAGGVGHLTKRLSLFYNTSRNVGVPSDVGRTILPEGKTPPPSDGVGKDLGFMFDLFGDDRYFLRATFYRTEQINDASINPNGTTVLNSPALGGENLQNIMLAFLAAGKINQQQFDEQAINYNATTSDLTTDGIEVEAVANPTKNLTLRLGYSKSKRRRGDFFSEIYAFYDAKAPQWRALAADNATLLATVNRELDLVNQDLDIQFTRQNSPFGTRPHKANATARYKLTEGALRGTFVGGGVRYQGKPYMADDPATGRVYWGNATIFGDAFAGYRFRVPHSKTMATVQLNVRNISNSYLARPARYNGDYTGLLRVYLAEPRSYRLTTTVEF